MVPICEHVVDWDDIKVVLLTVVFEGLIWSGFLTPKRGNHGPQLVQMVALIGRTTTKPTRTSPRQFGCPQKTGCHQFFRHFSILIKIYYILNKTNYIAPCEQVLTAVTGHSKREKKKIRWKQKKMTPLMFVARAGPLLQHHCPCLSSWCQCSWLVCHSLSLPALPVVATSSSLLFIPRHPHCQHLHCPLWAVAHRWGGGAVWCGTRDLLPPCEQRHRVGGGLQGRHKDCDCY